MLRHPSLFLLTVGKWYRAFDMFLTRAFSNYVVSKGKDGEKASLLVLRMDRTGSHGGQALRLHRVRHLLHRQGSVQSPSLGAWYGCRRLLHHSEAYGARLLEGSHRRM